MPIRLRKIIWQTVVILIVGAALGFAVNSFSKNPLSLKYQHPKEPQWKTVTLAQVKQYAAEGTAIFIDARDPNEFEAGHLPEAINLPSAQFGDYYVKEGDKLPREEIPLIIYCQGEPCDQSLDVLEYLKNLEFRNLYLYPGGWNEWNKDGK